MSAVRESLMLDPMPASPLSSSPPSSSVLLLVHAAALCVAATVCCCSSCGNPVMTTVWFHDLPVISSTVAATVFCYSLCLSLSLCASKP
eukprot:1695978-Rhodomonas_salina.1